MILFVAASATIDLDLNLVRVSTAPPVGDGTMLELFAAFAQAYPKIRVELVVTSRRVNLVEEGIDLALRAGKLDDSNLVARNVPASGSR